MANMSLRSGAGPFAMADVTKPEGTCFTEEARLQTESRNKKETLDVPRFLGVCLRRIRLS